MVPRSNVISSPRSAARITLLSPFDPHSSIRLETTNFGFMRYHCSCRPDTQSLSPPSSIPKCTCSPSVRCESFLSPDRLIRFFSSRKAIIGPALLLAYMLVFWARFAPRLYVGLPCFATIRTSVAASCLITRVRANHALSNVIAHPCLKRIARELSPLPIIPRSPTL